MMDPPSITVVLRYTVLSVESLQLLGEEGD